MVTGADSASTAEVSTATTGLMLSIAPGIAQADGADQPLRIVVTGEEGSRYAEPNAKTATRTDTPLRDIPQSIQVIPRQVLEDQQVTRLSDALRNASGVFLETNNGGVGQEIIVRGFARTTTLRDGFRQPGSGELLPGWNLIANYAYLDTKITEDNTGLEGNRFFGTPEHSANLWTTYKIQSGDLQGLSFGIGFNFVGERFGDDANSFKLDSYFLTNAAIAYQRDDWRAALNFRNLFDVDYIEAAQNIKLSVEPGEDFTVIGSVSIEF